MARLISWSILIAIFLLAGYGLNMIRIAVIDNIANPETVIWWKILVGFLLMSGGIAFIGGFVFYRDKKQGKVRKPAWKEKEIRRH